MHPRNFDMGQRGGDLELKAYLSSLARFLCQHNRVASLEAQLLQLGDLEHGQLRKAQRVRVVRLCDVTDERCVSLVGVVK